MTTPYDRYPLVQKALREQEAVFATADGGLPAELRDATLRGLDLLRDCVPTSDAALESMMAVSVLMNCPPYIALKSPRFADDYNPHVQAMLDAHVRGEGVAQVGADLAQVYSALFIAHGENLLRDIAQNPPQSAHWRSDMAENLENYIEDRSAYVDRIAKPLLAIETALIEKTFAALSHNHPAPPAPKPGKPRL